MHVLELLLILYMATFQYDYIRTTT